MPNDQKIICPSCKDPVSDFIVDHRLTVNHCIRCQMLWLDQGESALLLGDKHADLLNGSLNNSPFFKNNSFESGDPVFNCPRCDNSRLTEDKIHQFRYRRCRSCSGILIEMETIQKLKKINQTEEALLGRAIEPLGGQIARRRFLKPPSGFLFHSTTSRLAIPVVALVSLMFVKLGGGIVLYLTGMIVHEVGHSVAGWLSGIPNVITPVMVRLLSHDTHVSVAILLMMIFSLMFFLWVKRSREKNERTEFMLISAFLLALCLAQFYCSFVIPFEKKYIFFGFSGILGEFVINAFLIVIFCFRSIPIPRWDFWRYPLMIYGVVHFVHTWSYWSSIFADHSLIPWGTAISSEVSDGDLAKLRDGHGFTPDQILKTIALTRRICFGLISIALLSLFFRKDDPSSSENLT